MQNTPKAANDPVIEIAIHHQSGVLRSTPPAIRSVTEAMERFFSTRGGLGMRSTKGTILASVSAIMHFLQKLGFSPAAAGDSPVPARQTHARR